MVRSVCCGKNSVKRGVWTAEEDSKILAFVSKHGCGNWTSVPKKAGLKRCGKSCRLRWTNYLRPDLKHDNFTPPEEDLIIKLHAAIGSRWSIIAQQLPGRTDNDVKNYWNTNVKKKLSQMGIDPVTHKPFSKLIADYGNIGGSCHKPSSTQMGPIINDSNNALILLKSEPHHQTMPRGYNNRNTNNGQPKQSPTSPPKMGTTPIVKGASNCIDLLENETILLASMFGESCLSKTPSSPSTSSTCSNSTQEPALHVPFSWNDFLLEDAFAVPLAADNQEEQEIVGSQIENVTRQNWDKKEVASQQCNEYYHQFSPSSSDISFVEALLDQENEMFLSFPHLLEEPSHY